MGMTSIVQPSQYIDVRGPGGPARIYPIVGHPDSLRAQGVFDTCRKPRPINAALLYDEDGMQQARRRHLQWLNQHLPPAVRLLPVTEITTWAKTR
jgi:hypothetical protein